MKEQEYESIELSIQALQEDMKATTQAQNHSTIVTKYIPHWITRLDDVLKMVQTMVDQTPQHPQDEGFHDLKT